MESRDKMTINFEHMKPWKAAYADFRLVELNAIKERAMRSSYEGIETILEGLEKAKARLKANVNFELTMELLLLTIKEN